MLEPPKGLAPSTGLAVAVDGALQPRDIAQLDVVVHADTLVLTLGGVSGTAAEGARATTARRPARSAPSPGYSRVGTAAGAQGTGTAAAAKGTSAARSKTSSSTSTSSTSTGPLAFLDDPKLSVEEKLFKFMSYVADKYDKAIEKKMDEIAGKQSTASTSTKKKSGLLGKIASGVSGVVGGLTGSGGGAGGLLGAVLPAAGLTMDLLQDTGVQKLVSQLSGPVLAVGATALGFPELAPALLQAGPGIARGAFEVVDALAGETSTSSSAKSASSSTRTAGDPQVEQKDLLELQHLQNKQQEMFGLVSNMLRSMHDTKMATVNNIRV